MLHRLILLVGLAVVTPAADSLAQQRPMPFVGENLLVTLPDGYKVGHTAKNDKISITEMVPKAESVNNWTEMVTTQIFFGRKLAPQQFKSRMDMLWSQACAGSSSHQVAEADENGYRSLVWTLACPLNKQTGKPEWTWFRAIAGSDSFYVVQKAFRFEPSQAQVVRWTNYLNSVALCDSRIRESDCKSGSGTR